MTRVLRKAKLRADTDFYAYYQRLILQIGPTPIGTQISREDKAAFYFDARLRPRKAILFADPRSFDDRYFGETALRSAWEKSKAEILAEWIDEKPGTRPWAWWRYSAPEPRRQVVQGHDQYRDSDRERLSFGVLRIYDVETLRRGLMVESEASYLDRLGLLSEAEREAIGDFPTEEVICKGIEK
jgi:hypothetical protein